MSKKIQGIIVEIGGDVTGLDKALSNANKSINNTQRALREVNKLLKLDPTNTTLLTQKYDYLQEDIKNTEDKLNALKEADKLAKAQLEAGTLGKEKYDALQREIIETTEEYKNLKKEIGSGSSFWAGVSAGAKEFGESVESAANKVKPLSTAATGLAAAALATVPATEELRTDLSKLDNNAKEAGVGVDTARKAFEAFTVASDETDSSVEATANLLQAGFTESNLQKAVEGLTGAYLRFPDTLKIESLADSLQETIATGEATGQFGELLDRLGISAETFSEQLANCATDAEKQNLALETLASAGLNDTYNSWIANNQQLAESKQATLDFQLAMSQLAEILTPIITKITQFGTTLLNTFNNLPAPMQNVIMGLVALVAALAPVLSVTANVSKGISTLTGIFSTAAFQSNGVVKALGVLKSAFSSLFTLIKAHPVLAVATVIITALVTLYNKCEWFRNMVNTILKAVGTFFSNLGSTIKNIASSAVSVISSMVSSIVNFFNNLKNNASNIFNNIKSNVSNIVSSIKDKAVNTFGNLVSGIRSKLSSVTSAVTSGFHGAISYITSLPSKALGWGSDFISGMAQGIRNAAGRVISAAQSVASSIASFLHFSRPDKGPLHYYEEWMPDFMTGLAGGIKKNMYKVTNAVSDLADKMVVNPNINMYSEPVASNISVAAPVVTVMIGNEKFDGYIVQTAKTGINDSVLNYSRGKGIA